MSARFSDKLAERVKTTGAMLCVGLDPDFGRIPMSLTQAGDPLYRFCRAIVEATAEFACAFKPNVSFFEAYGSDGIAQLEKLRADIPDDIPVILDAKRGDIGNTARMSARFLFEHLKGDAATVSPYLGRDSLEPFLAYEGRCAFVLAVTSNAGAVDVQFHTDGESRVYHRVIEITQRVPGPGERGFVVGAQRIEILREIRELADDVPLLIPGIGTQGGDLEAALEAGTAGGTRPAVINVSRDIIYADSGSSFADAAAAKAQEYRDRMLAVMSRTAI